MINTCGEFGMVAIADESGVLQAEQLPGRTSSETLTGAVRRSLREIGRLDAVAVVYGPGSFTGVRVGLSAAKGLCEARGARMIAISRLALVAGDTGVALLDAGRGEYFCGVYSAGKCVSEELLRAEEVTIRLAGQVPVTCEARMVERVGVEVRLVAEPGAPEILATAWRRIAAGDWSDVATIDANYLRRTDAELLVERR